METLDKAPIREASLFLAGRTVFTVEVPQSYLNIVDKMNAEAKKNGNDNPPACKPHYTYRITYKAANGKFAETYFVQLLTGPDNTSDFSYLGRLNAETGEVTLSTKSCAGEGSYAARIVRRVLACYWDNQQDKIVTSGFDIHHEGRCCRCGRVLTHPDSVRSGVGSECAKRI